MPSHHTSSYETTVKSIYDRRKTSVRPGIYSYFDPGNLFNIQYRERRILKALVRAGFNNLKDHKILEVGCGWGFWLRTFLSWGALPENVTGIDILPDRVAKAARSCPAAVDIRCAQATDLPYPARSFDIVFQATVFSSILDSETRIRAAAEMTRVAKPKGLILWYDFFVRNPRNSDLRAVPMTEIKAYSRKPKSHLSG
jgi:ubiquinone/menaquinone biosynthesis C-methylase UbiE